MQLFSPEREYIVYVIAGLLLGLCTGSGSYGRFRRTIAMWPPVQRIATETLTSLYVVYVAIFVLALVTHPAAPLPTACLLFVTMFLSNVTAVALCILAGLDRTSVPPPTIPPAPLAARPQSPPVVASTTGGPTIDQPTAGDDATIARG